MSECHYPHNVNAQGVIWKHSAQKISLPILQETYQGEDTTSRIFALRPMMLSEQIEMRLILSGGLTTLYQRHSKKWGCRLRSLRVHL